MRRLAALRHQHEDREEDRLERDDRRQHAVRIRIELRAAREAGDVPEDPDDEQRSRGRRETAVELAKPIMPVGENLHRRSVRRVLGLDRAEGRVDAGAATHRVARRCSAGSSVVSLLSEPVSSGCISRLRREGRIKLTQSRGHFLCTRKSLTFHSWPHRPRSRSESFRKRSRDDVDKNVERAEARIREAADKGAQIVCLQELFNAPYFCKSQKHERFDLAEPIPRTDDRADAEARAASWRSVIIVPIFERQAAGVYRNSAAVDRRRRLAARRLSQDAHPRRSALQREVLLHAGRLARRRRRRSQGRERISRLEDALREHRRADLLGPVVSGGRAHHAACSAPR